MPPTTVTRSRSSLLTTSEAAKELEVNDQAIRYLIRSGRLDAYQESGSRRMYILKSNVKAMKRVKLVRVNPKEVAGAGDE